MINGILKIFLNNFRKNTGDIEELQLQPVNFGLPEMKELGAKWLVDMADYISNNPQMIVNGFIHSEITGSIDGQDFNDPDDSAMDIESDQSANYLEESEAYFSDSQ